MDRILVRLAGRMLHMLLHCALLLALQMTGCLVRLLYWSVRTYGWGRVGSFLLAAYTAGLVQARFWGLEWNAAMA